MEHHIKIKQIFKPEIIHKEFYTGGILEITQDGENILCQCSNHITIVNLENERIKQTIPPDLIEFSAKDDYDDIDDPILTFAVAKEFLASGHKSGLIKLWKWKNSELIKTWKNVDKGLLIKLAFNENTDFLASGGTKSSIRVWNINDHNRSYKLEGVEGVTSILEYHKIWNKDFIFASGNEFVIRGWRQEENGSFNLVFKLNGHFSQITKILFTFDDSYLISCSRELIVIVWDLKKKKQLRCIPMYESINSAAVLPSCLELPGFEKPICGTFVAFGGENGKIRIWDIINNKEVYVHDHNSSEKNAITHLIFNDTIKKLIEVRFDHTMFIYNLDFNFSCEKQIVGFLNEIVDVRFFGENDKYLIVAANSPDVFVFDERMNCKLLKGHTKFVMCFSISQSFPNIFVSGSKDNSIRVWMIKDDVIQCVAVGSRHTNSVLAVALSNMSRNAFILSAGEDNTMKMWELPLLKYKQCLTLNVWKTEVVHDLPVNSICVSPRDDIIATGSEDKTVKLWSRDLSLIGVLRGHRRSVWCVKFSPTDEVLLSSSGDTTLKLWSIRELTCLKTFEGQDCSVLNCSFFNNGIQFISCGNDGVVRVWSIKNNECVATLDKHSSTVWGVAVSSDESKFVTGGADSRLVLWQDTTEEARIEEIKSRQERVEQEQYLQNLIQSNELLKALQYAINLDRPLQVLKIIEHESCKEREELRKIIDELNVDQKEKLLTYVTEWNTNSKRCYIAQLILHFLINDITDNKLKLSSKTSDGLIAYTKRHHSRLISLLEDVQLLTYTIKKMKPHSN